MVGFSILAYIASVLGCYRCYQEAYSKGGIYYPLKSGVDDWFVLFTPILNTMFILMYIAFFRNYK